MATIHTEHITIESEDLKLLLQLFKKSIISV